MIAPFPPLPTSYPTGNSHRVVLYQEPAPRPELERLEEMVADGLAALRRALQLREDLPAAHATALRAWEPVARCLDQRRLIDAGSRTAIVDLFVEAARIAQREGPHPALDELRHQLAEAEALATRIADLLAAEDQVARARGFDPGTRR